LAQAFVARCHVPADRVLSPGLGQDGFGAVENGCGKVAFGQPEDLTDRGRWIASDRGAELDAFGLAALADGRVSWRECNALPSLALARGQSADLDSCDSDEMVVIHPLWGAGRLAGDRDAAKRVRGDRERFRSRLPRANPRRGNPRGAASGRRAKPTAGRQGLSGR
jgi:hypothetical protein